MSFLIWHSLTSEKLLQLQSGNFLNNLEVHLVCFQAGHCNWFGGFLGKVGFPFQCVSKTMALLGMTNAYGCYDANTETKSGKILRIFRYHVRAVTILPPLQESRPEILGLSEEGGVFLTKASFSLPGSFFFGISPVYPNDEWFQNEIKNAKKT